MISDAKIRIRKSRSLEILEADDQPLGMFRKNAQSATQTLNHFFQNINIVKILTEQKNKRKRNRINKKTNLTFFSFYIVKNNILKIKQGVSHF